MSDKWSQKTRVCTEQRKLTGSQWLKALLLGRPRTETIFIRVTEADPRYETAPYEIGYLPMESLWTGKI